MLELKYFGNQNHELNSLKFISVFIADGIGFNIIFFSVDLTWIRK